MPTVTAPPATKKPATARAHRWWITCELSSTTPLSIGDGSITAGRIPIPKNGTTLPEINAVARNHKGEPYIPATGLKGALRAVARNATGFAADQIQRLFGDNPTDPTGTVSRRAGAVDFHDAHFAKFADKPATAIEVALSTATMAAPTEVPAAAPVAKLDKKPAIGERVSYGASTRPQRTQQLSAAPTPRANLAPTEPKSPQAPRPPDRTLLAHYDEEKKTFIETSTRIDRDRGTVDDRHLFNDERVAPGAVFTLSFFVQHTSKEGGEAAIADLLGLINLANGEGGLALGGDAGRGFGRTKFSDPAVKYFGEAQLKIWQNNLFAGTWQEAAKTVVIAPSALSNNAAATTIQLNIHFNGLYLVNEPFRTTTGADGAAHTPRLDETDNPVLPARTLQGALRSQSERILRTLGIDCCGAGGVKSCAVEKSKPEDFCLACQLYGNSKRAARVTQPSPPECTSPGSTHKQDFIAIDRFTGGGKDGAKFNAKSAFKPKFIATLSVANDACDAARGLLLLTLRDLAEGDIPLGWGKRKGYGDCTVASEPAKPFLERAALALTNTATGESALEALRELPRGHAQTSSLPSNFDTLFAVPPNPANGTNPKDAAASTASKAPAPALAKPATISGVADRFHNTYHFIPLEASDVPKWATVGDFKDSKKWKTEEGIGVHSHARYANGTETAPVFSGRIECTLTAETPFIVGGERTKVDGQATAVAHYKINDKLVIPATTLKGMIGNIAEAASGSAMRIFDGKQAVTFRSRADLEEVMNQVGQLGSYLTTDENGNSVENWFIRPLLHERDFSFVATGTLAAAGKVQLHMAGFGRQMAGRRENTLQVNASLVAPTLMQDGDLHVSQALFDSVQCRADERTRELYPPRVTKLSANDVGIHRKTAVPFHLEPQAAQGETLSATFEKIAKRNSNTDAKSAFDQMRLVPRAGDIVRFRTQQMGSTMQVVDFGYSAIWRGVSTKSSGAVDFLENFVGINLRPLTAQNESPRSISPAEMLFGFVAIGEVENDHDAAHSFCGKLRFHDATINVATELPAVPLKILSAPKPPSPSLYFKLKTSTTGAHIAKRDINSVQHAIKGRKHYLHALHKDGAVTKLGIDGTADDVNGVEPWRTRQTSATHAKQGVSAMPLDVGSSFNFAVSFDNLTLNELSLLAFSLNPSEAFRHKLGLGKPIGLGTVKIEPKLITLVDRIARYAFAPLTALACRSLRVDQWTQLASTYGGSATAKNALRLLGNPNNVKLPVHYPQLAGQNIEEKTYQWFVANDRHSGTGLKSLDVRSSQIPDLPRTPVGATPVPQRRR